MGDSAIVEADRGDDLSTVVNDTITLKEVEAFDREQRERVVYGDSRPLSTGGQQGGKPKDDVWKGAVSGYSVRGFTWPHVLAYRCFNRQLVTILQDEIKALRLCQNKVRHSIMDTMDELRQRNTSPVREQFERLHSMTWWMPASG